MPTWSERRRLDLEEVLVPVPILSQAPTPPVEAPVPPLSRREPLLIRLFRRLDDNLAEV